jgi:RNA polymerase sporulation-specific sigma factor
MKKKSKMKVEVSLDEPLKVDGEGNELLLSDVLGSDSNDIFDEIEDVEKRKLLYDAIDTLRPREKLILKMRFGLFECEEMTQKDVADSLGISQSYISRLEKRILDKMRNIIEERVKVA